MKLLSVVLTLMLIACKPADAPLKPVIPSPHGRYLQADFDSMVNISPEVVPRLYEAQRQLNALFASTAFKAAIYNARFVQTNNLTNEEIYNLIQSGQERIKPANDGVMNLNIHGYKVVSDVYGYTYPWSLKIYVNMYHYEVFSVAELAANLTHEYMHLLGFHHDFKPTERRDYSVPYAVGYIVKELLHDNG